MHVEISHGFDHFRGYPPPPPPGAHEEDVDAWPRSFGASAAAPLGGAERIGTPVYDWLIGMLWVRRSQLSDDATKVRTPLFPPYSTV